MEHNLRKSSEDSEGAQTNMEYKKFPVSKSRELQKMRKLYQGERQTMTCHELYLKVGMRFKNDGFGLHTRFN